MPRILVVAYGNPLRSDDGVAWRATEALEGTFRESEVEILRLQQLAPEVAEDLRQSDLAIFLDAAYVDDLEQGHAGEIRSHEVSREEPSHYPGGHFTHAYSPAKVLDLARELYGADPKALVITVAGQNFGHGESLSPPVADALPKLIATVERRVKESLSKASTTKDTKELRA